MAKFDFQDTDTIFTGAFNAYNLAKRVGVREFSRSYNEGDYTDELGIQYTVKCLGSCVTQEQWLKLSFKDPSLITSYLMWVVDAVPSLMLSDKLAVHDHYETLIKITPVTVEPLQFDI